MISTVTKFKIFFLKFLSSSYVTVISLIGSFLFNYLIFFLAFTTSKFKCTFETLGFIKSFHSILLIIVYFFIILSGIIDMIGNFQILIKCQWIKYIFKSDPHYFRIQILLFIPFMIYSLITEIYGAASTERYVGYLRSFNLIISFSTTGCAALLIIEVLFPLIITIIKYVYLKIKSKKGNEDELTSVLKDPETLKMFVEFSKSEFSVENITSWMDIQNFKKGKKTQEEALEIYFKYFNQSSSIMEVNVTRAESLKLKSFIDKNEINENIFEEIEKSVMINISDTYSRFMFFDPFLQHKNAKEQKLKMIENIK